MSKNSSNFNNRPRVGFTTRDGQVHVFKDDEQMIGYLTNHFFGSEQKTLAALNSPEIDNQFMFFKLSYTTPIVRTKLVFEGLA